MIIGQRTKDKGQRHIGYKLGVILLLPVTCYLLLVTTVLAQSPSPTTASPAPTPKAAKDESATKSATDEVRDKVRQKIEDLVRKPRAAVGTLSEVTDSTLNLAAKSGKSEMVATEKTTSYVRMVDGKKTEIKFDELVIGDFIVAMGYRNGNNVLEAKRVIAYDKSPLTARKSVYGVVQSNEKGVLTLQHPKTQEVWKLKTNSKTKATKKGDRGFEDIKVADIQNGNRVTAAGVPSEKEQNTLTAGRIHVIPGKTEGLTGTPKPTKSPPPTGGPTPKSSLSPSPTQ